MNNNIIKVCINRALCYSDSYIGYKEFFTDIQYCLYLTNNIKHVSKCIYRKMLTTDEMLLVNNIVELISVRTSKKKQLIVLIIKF